MGPASNAGKRQGVSHEGHSDIIVARRLRQFRLHASLTQQLLADQMTAAGHHMANSPVSNIESGRRLVTIGEAVQFATVLGIPLLALVTDDSPGYPHRAQTATWH